MRESRHVLQTRHTQLTFALVGTLSLPNNVDGPGQGLVAHVTVGGSVVPDLNKLVSLDIHLLRLLKWDNKFSEGSCELSMERERSCQLRFTRQGDKLIDRSLLH